MAAQPCMVGKREHFPVTLTIAIGIEHSRLIAAEPLLQSPHFFRSPAIRGSQVTRKTVVMKFELGCQYRVESRSRSPALQVERRRRADQHELMATALMLLDSRGHFRPNELRQSLSHVLLRRVFQFAPGHGADRRGKKMRFRGASVARVDQHASHPRRRANRAIDQSRTADRVMHKITEAVGRGDGAVEIEGGNDPIARQCSIGV